MMINYLPGGRGQSHVTHFHIFGAQAILLERMKLDISNLVLQIERKEYWHCTC